MRSFLFDEQMELPLWKKCFSIFLKTNLVINFSNSKANPIDYTSWSKITSENLFKIQS